MASPENNEDACSRGIPKSPYFLGVSDMSDQPSTSEFSITNPFESHNTIDSLLQPSFSPSVFTTNASSDTEEHTTPSRFWNIDQIAVLKPTDIDLSTLPNQQDFVRLDPTNERKAQQAIEEYFASHIELPSPWSTDQSNSHYLALISPSPAQMKKKANMMTPCTGRPGVLSSAASSVSSSSQIRVRRLQLHPNSKHPPSTSKDGAGFSTKQQKVHPKESKNASTQTTLTLPRDFDLESVLKQYYTFCHGAENQNDTLNNTSLRRKLIFPDGREVQTHDKDGEMNLNALQHIDDIHELENFSESPVPLMKKIQADNNNLTPVVHPTHGDISRTPSTCQSHFSSSPMGFEHKTPCSSNSQRPRFGSGVRRRRMILGSSEDEELISTHLEAIHSPELSPVKCDSLTGVDGHMTGIADVMADESMSFRVCDDNPSQKMVSESENRSFRNQLSTMESSRRQLVLVSPTLSPIKPIKFKTNVTQSSINKVNSLESVPIPVETHALCPSPMLSPIPCKASSNMKGKDAESQHNATAAPLSSTVTQPILVASSDYDTHVEATSEFDAGSSNTDVGMECFRRKVQYFDAEVGSENKENISPSVAVCSSMLSTGNQDVSMALDDSSIDMCNDIYMQTEKHSSSVLYCGQGFSGSIPVQTSSNSNQLVSSEEAMFRNSEICSGIQPADGRCKPRISMGCCLDTVTRNACARKLNTAMDVSITRCRTLEDSANPPRPTEYQGDSGYATTQSNYHVV